MQSTKPPQTLELVEFSGGECGDENTSSAPLRSATASLKQSRHVFRPRITPIVRILTKPC
jgi:hypothetical protein